jgi:hypothetical protein
LVAKEWADEPANACETWQKRGRTVDGTACASSLSSVAEPTAQERLKMSVFPGPEYFRDNVAMRNDTILGVCEALGRDLRFNPMFLRAPLAAGIIFAPFAVVGIYFALAALVFVSRTFFPNKVTQVAPASAEVITRDAHNEQVELPRAA